MTDNKFITNSFQIPNAVIDELLAELSGAELKCYLFVLRKTKGWNKEYDSISVSQFMEVTGLSNRKVIDACNRLVELGLLTQKTGVRGVKVYSVDLCRKFTSEETSPVKKVHSTCEESSLDPVKKVHTQNNTIKKHYLKNNNKKTTQKKTALSLLESFGIPENLSEDFIAHRKSFKGGAEITETAMNRIQKQADIAKLPLAEVLEIMIDRGWRGFKAEWLSESSGVARTGKGVAANNPKFADDGKWAEGMEMFVDENGKVKVWLKDQDRQFGF
ncbi:replication protein [Lonepinella sp. BR2904]|uniref:replication protein n=1 Tax=Lonepinella sp. BR2904 TaxID=3434551 RepID=UPI003F6E3BA0